MQQKDYYNTLHVHPSASTLQIRKSFRQLAMIHHPDKNPGNPLAEATFKEIQEAYETLIDPQKREHYNYNRWYSRNAKDVFAEEPPDAAAILKECTRLNNYIHTANGQRVDFDGLSYHIRQLLNNNNRAVLHASGDESVRAGIIENLLQPAAMLPFKYLEPVTSLLLQVADNNSVLIKQVHQFVRQQKRLHTWQKYRIAMVTAITLLLCWMIYVISR